jgi:hypothetical protein
MPRRNAAMPRSIDPRVARVVHFRLRDSCSAAARFAQAAPAAQRAVVDPALDHPAAAQRRSTHGGVARTRPPGSSR